MSSFKYPQNSVFEHNGAFYQIISVLNKGDGYVVRQLDTNKDQYIPHSELIEKFSGAEIKKIVGPAEARGFYGRPLEDLNPQTQLEVKRRRAYVEELLKEPELKFTKPFLYQVASKVAARIHDAVVPSAATLWRWVSKYSQDRNTRALVPRFDRRGKRSGMNDEQTSFILKAIERASLGPRVSIKTILAQFKSLIIGENQLRLPVEQMRFISESTLRRRLDEIGQEQLVDLRINHKNLDAIYKMVGAGVVVFDILERVEVDHTPLDLFIVDTESGEILGRPTLTIAIDCYSRMPLGYFISMAPPSSESLIGLFRHMVERKSPVKAALEGVKVKNLWPCYGTMQVLVVDNGLEFHGTAFDQVCYDLGISIIYCPKRAPKNKGRIERFIKTINHSFIHTLPGSTLAKFHERGDYDPLKHAVLTMAQLHHVFEKWLLDDYAQSIHAGIKTTPWKKWHEGLSRVVPTPPENIENLKLRIGRPAERKIQAQGILFLGEWYASWELERIRRESVGSKVRIVSDPFDMGSIQVWAPDAQDPITVPAVNQSCLNGLTLTQHKFQREIKRNAGTSGVDREAPESSKLEVSNAIFDLQQSKKVRQKQKAARFRGISSLHPEGTIRGADTAALLKMQPTMKPVFDGGIPEESLERYTNFTLDEEATA